MTYRVFRDKKRHRDQVAPLQPPRPKQIAIAVHLALRAWPYYR